MALTTNAHFVYHFTSAHGAVQAELNSNCAPWRGLPTVLIVCACLRQYAPDGAVYFLGCAADGATEKINVWHSEDNFKIFWVYIHVLHDIILDFLNYELHIFRHMKTLLNWKYYQGKFCHIRPQLKPKRFLLFSVQEVPHSVV